MTVAIVGTVTARPDCWGELVELLGEQVAPTRAEAGCSQDRSTFAIFTCSAA